MVVNLHIQFVERSVPDSCVLASLRDPSRRVLRARDTRYARVAGLAARGGLAAAPPPQLTRNGATQSVRVIKTSKDVRTFTDIVL